MRAVYNGATQIVFADQHEANGADSNKESDQHWLRHIWKPAEGLDTSGSMNTEKLR